jgi:hypothetical protein
VALLHPGQRRDTGQDDLQPALEAGGAIAEYVERLGRACAR